MAWTDLDPITKTRMKVWEYINALIGNTEYNKTGGGGSGDLSQNKITKFEVANGTDADHDIDFSGGQCTDSTNDHYLEDSSGMTKRIDATWAVGNGNGGLFSGASLNTYSWYYPYVIEADSGDTIDYGFDDNINGDNVPSGYTHFRKLRGAFLTDASSNILGFTQTGNLFLFNTKILEFSSSTLPTTRTAQALSVPPNFLALLNVRISSNGTGFIVVSNYNDADIAPSQTYCDLIYTPGGTEPSLELIRRTNSSSQIYWRSSNSSTSVGGYITTIGFFDDGEYYL